jgi:hypothetical protein
MNLKPRVRRLERANAIDADDWQSSLSDDELLFWIHHKSRAVLADPGIAAEDRAKVAAKIAALPPPLSIDEQRARVLIAHHF